MNDINHYWTHNRYPLVDGYVDLARRTDDIVERRIPLPGENLSFVALPLLLVVLGCTQLPLLPWWSNAIKRDLVIVIASVAILAILSLPVTKKLNENEAKRVAQCTELYLAILEKNLPKVEELYPQCAFSFFLPQPLQRVLDRQSVLSYAITKGDLPTIRYLAENGEGANELYLSLRHKKLSLLTYAVMRGDREIVSFCVKEIREGRLYQTKDAPHYLNHALIWAAWMGKKEIVDLLLTNGARAGSVFTYHDNIVNSALVYDREIFKNTLASSVQPTRNATYFRPPHRDSLASLTRLNAHFSPDEEIPDARAIQIDAMELLPLALLLQKEYLEQKLSLILQDVQGEVFSYFRFGANEQHADLSLEEKNFCILYKSLPIEMQMRVAKSKARTIVTELIRTSPRPTDYSKSSMIWRSLNGRDLLPVVQFFEPDIQSGLGEFIRIGDFPDPNNRIITHYARSIVHNISTWEHFILLFGHSG